MKVLVVLKVHLNQGKIANLISMIIISMKEKKNMIWKPHDKNINNRNEQNINNNNHNLNNTHNHNLDFEDIANYLIYFL